MWKPTIAAALLLLVARPALAEDAPCSTSTPAAVGCAAPKPVPAPPALTPASVPPRPEPVTRIPPAFYGRFLSYDEDEKRVVMGTDHHPLSRDEFYGALGRADLLERSRTMERRRLIFGVSGAAVFVTGMVAAVVARAGMPDLNSFYCTSTASNYNQICVPDAKRREAIFATGLVAGISVGGLLGALAIGSNPEILSKDDTQALVAGHNTTLLRKLREGARSVQLTPQASWQGGGLSATFHF